MRPGEEKGKELTKSYDPNLLYTNREYIKQQNIKNLTKMFDYTIITDRLRNFSCYSPQTLKNIPIPSICRAIQT